MSHEIQETDANLAHIARLEAELDTALTLISGLRRTLSQAQERERITAETYHAQQSSYREMEALYLASSERCLQVQADAAALRAEMAASRERADKAEMVCEQVYLSLLC